MKTKFLTIVGLSFLALAGSVGCNSVSFTQNPKSCTASTPCLQANGLYNFSQSLTFSTTRRVDILVVDDNSGSMTQEQASLASPFNGFISNLMNSGLDWQVAVTNTDVCPIGGGNCWTPNGITGAQGQFVGPTDGSGGQPSYGNNILNSATPNAASVFSTIIQRGNEVGSGDERAIYAVNDAISANNKAFFRDNSELAIVILSDEDERSTGGNCAPPNPNQPSVCDAGYVPLEQNDLPVTLMNNVDKTFGGKKSLLVNSIIIKPGDTSCLAIQAAQGPYYTAHYGNTYSDLSTLAQNNSTVGNICNNNDGSYANMITNVSQAIQHLPTTNTMVLNYVPSSQPTVTFSPATNSVPWTWNSGSNVITFVTRPADNTTVTVNASYSATQQMSYLKNVLKFNTSNFSLGVSTAQVSNGRSDSGN